MFGLSPKFPHTPRKVAPRTVVEQQLADAARYNPDWHFAYSQRPRIPQTNTGNYAYVTLGLAEFSPVGPGVVKRQSIKALASNGKPLVYFQAVPMQGLGGLVQGQIFGTPLINPNAQNV